MDYELSLNYAPVVAVFAEAAEDQAVEVSVAEADSFVLTKIEQDLSQGVEKYTILDDGTMFSTETGLFIAMHGTVEETIAAYGGEGDMLYIALLNSLAGDSQAAWEATLAYNGMTE